MNSLKNLVLMQLKDKIDLSWLNTRKGKIQKIVLSIFKFLIITFLTFLLLTIFVEKLQILTMRVETVQLLIVIFSILMILSFLSCTYGLMKSLYYADDNKVLVTFPVHGNIILFSKLIVYFLYEIKRNLNLLVPLLLGFFMFLNKVNGISWTVFLWMWIPLFFISLTPVLLGALFSIPLLFIVRFLQRHTFLQALLIFICFVGVLALVIYGIGLIPENIDLVNQWPSIRKWIKDNLKAYEKSMNLFSQGIFIMIGNFVPTKYVIQGTTFLKFLIFVFGLVFLGGLVFFTSRPLFFYMMTKTFEFDKKEGNMEEKNIVRKPAITFVNKEFIINFRSIEISGSYISVYIIIPVLIYFLNSLFAAMNTKLSGQIMTYSFNLLLIILPLLASNSMIATLYSKEGRAGYMKKTKPIDPIYALIAKLVFNLVLSIPSISITMAIFGAFSSLEVGSVVMLGFGILFLQYGHILWSATLDIMNPQNEQYATTGEEINNPNENKSILIAFILSIFFALISYKLFNESLTFYNSFLMGSFKLMLLGLMVFGSTALLFVLKIKAYYYEK